MKRQAINTISAFQQATDGTLSTAPELYGHIKYLLIDSRRLLFASSTCFFALSGARRDGHDYIEDLYAKGVRYFVVHQDYSAPALDEAVFLYVPNVLKALQDIAAAHRHQFDLPVIGVTGSNGKTIVKEWLYTLLQEDAMVVRSPGSYNSQIGVPLSVWQIEDNHEIGIFEAGISTKGEMDALSYIIDPDICLLLNIGSAHDAGFNNRAEKVKEKLKLAQRAKTIIYPSDDDLIYEAVHTHLPTNIDKKAWGKDKSRQPYIWLEDVSPISDQSAQIRVHIHGQVYDYIVPFRAEIDIHNIMHCITYLHHARYDDQMIKSRLMRLEPLNMRLELRKGIRDSIIINDTYSNDPESLQAGLSFLAQQGGDRRRVLILSEFRDQVELNSGEWQEKIIQLVRQYDISVFYGLGPSIRIITEQIAKEIDAHHFDTSEEVYKHLLSAQYSRTAILFKAARYYKLDKWVNTFLSKSHKTILEVNMEAMSENLRVLTSKLRPDTGIIIMLKSFAYGSGDIELARFFEEARVSYLATAYPDEAIKLRQSGIQAPIMVLHPDADSLDKLWQYKLEPEVYSLEQLDNMALQMAPGNRYKIHLKLDTGMNRLGFRKEEMSRLVNRLVDIDGVEVATVFTHLAAADKPDFDAFTRQQLDTFDWMYHELISRTHFRPRRHALNSAGTLRFTEHQMDYVRLGIGLYGVNDHSQLSPVHRLKAFVLQVKPIMPGESVGYDRAWYATEETDIAVVSIGYGDGLMRSAGLGQAQLWIRGHLYPIVGHVCMDLCMVNLGKDHQIMSGDEVVVFGPENPATHLAKACQTSVYEVVSRISERVNRTYISQ